MTEEMNIDATSENEEKNDELILRFRTPYTFDGETYNELDLSGLENVTAATLENVGRIVLKASPEQNPATLEMTLGYCQHLAARVTKLPFEFFKGLSAKDAISLKTLVVGFLYGGDSEN